MNRRTMPVTAALAATAALLLTACGGGDGDKASDKDKIAGADQGAKKSASPSASADAGTDRPKITLPKDDILKFGDATTGDAKKDAVLADNAERHRAIDAAIIKGDPSSEAVQFYSEGDAAASAVQWIKSVVDDGYSVTGTVRFYDREVQFRADGSARLTYCGDESKWFGKDRKTDKPEKTPVTKKSYVFYDASLKKSAKGVWKTTAVSSERGADQCQP
ncbi:hypothetical protein OG453_00815 [Streptomyces sp. NBC_01381]|uniref:hypothetical protein n=1 Tax=Streptomyces sp. NBC_01381 TaxID=2903845 RepID=UPI002256EA67|nr:hypothetical protein [Streptomyces sp. NBC_01381]MCX4665227.1 hypothetical protein [Streptomyces sp. NBC_01381]